MHITNFVILLKFSIKKIGFIKKMEFLNPHFSITYVRNAHVHSIEKFKNKKLIKFLEYQNNHMGYICSIT